MNTSSLHAALRASAGRAAKHIDDICELVGIAHVRKRLIRNLSKGYKQRTGLAQALVGHPSTIILDEPTVGLDPIQIIGVRNIIRELGNQGTVILSSHILPEVQSICKRVLVINEGKICADGLIDELSSGAEENHKLQLRVAGAGDEVLRVLKGVAGVAEVRPCPAARKGRRIILCAAWMKRTCGEACLPPYVTRGWYC